MPTLTITKSYADGDTLFEADLDNIKDDIENFLNVTKVNDDNIQSAGITGSTKLVDASVSSAKLASASVTTSKIADEAVTTAKILDANVTTAKILDSNVTTAKIADAAVTQAKRVALGQQLSSSSGSFSTTTTGNVDVTNLSVTITTTGRPVFVGCIGDTAVADSYFEGEDTVGGTGSLARIILNIYRGGTIIQTTRLANYFGSGASSAAMIISAPPGILWTIDPVAAGTYTYKINISDNSASRTKRAYNIKLIAYEL
jgi:hypothetical protein